jgi:hypothetical protein
MLKLFFPVSSIFFYSTVKILMMSGRPLATKLVNWVMINRLEFASKEETDDAP